MSVLTLILKEDKAFIYKQTLDVIKIFKNWIWNLGLCYNSWTMEFYWDISGSKLCF